MAQADVTGVSALERTEIMVTTNMPKPLLMRRCLTLSIVATASWAFSRYLSSLRGGSHSFWALLREEAPFWFLCTLPAVVLTAVGPDLVEAFRNWRKSKSK